MHLHSLRLRLLTLAPALALASGCVVIADDVASASDASTSGESDTSSGTETAATTGEGSVSDASTSASTSEGTTSVGTTSEGTTDGTTSDGTDGTTDGGTTGGVVCDEPEGVSFSFALDPEPDPFMDLEFTYLCEILGVSEKGGSLVVETACSDGDEPVEPSPSVVVEADPPTALAGLVPGQQVTLTYGQYVPWWSERWIRIAAGSQLLLAASSGSSLGSQGGVEVFAPVSIADEAGVCAPMEDFCGVTERLALMMTADDLPSTVLSGDFAIIGGDPGLSVWVAEASAYVGEIQCSDTPDTWYTLGVVFDGME